MDVFLLMRGASLVLCRLVIFLSSSLGVGNGLTRASFSRSANILGGGLFPRLGIFKSNLAFNAALAFAFALSIVGELAALDKPGLSSETTIGVK